MQSPRKPLLSRPGMIEFIKQKLYFAPVVARPQNRESSPYFFFTVDDELEYLSFFSDFGPLNIGHIYRFCIILHQHLTDQALQNKRIVLYCKDTPQRKANAALLISSYIMIINRLSPAEAFEPVAEMEFLSFRDAGYGKADFQLSIFDCLYGLCKALKKGLLRLDQFNLQEYEYYEKVENGDFNFVSHHFVAFASPVDSSFLSGSSFPGGLSTSFQNVLTYFISHDIRLVVRLNKELYNKETFTREGIAHVDMFFEDGSCPDLGIVRRFIVLAEDVISKGGKVAVHCKAGLGRTGTLIGAYLIYKYHFTAQEAIAFMRLMRPGMVVGPQAHYLYQYQMQFVLWSSQTLEQLDEEGELQKTNRPITPPSDHDMSGIKQHSKTAATKVDEYTTTPAQKPRPQSVIMSSTTPIPGQPRKTPHTVRTSQILANATAVAAGGVSVNHSITTASRSQRQVRPLGHKRAESCIVGTVKSGGAPHTQRAPLREMTLSAGLLGNEGEQGTEEAMSTAITPSSILGVRSTMSTLLGRAAEALKSKEDLKRKERRLSGFGIQTVS